MSPRQTDIAARESKHHRILMRAAELFSQQGYRATRMEDIAEAAGFTKAALYYYFPGGKEQILLELARWAWEQMAHIPESRFTGDPETDLEILLRTHAQLYKDNPQVFDVLFMESRLIQQLVQEKAPEIESIRHRYLQSYARVLSKQVRPEELPTLMKAIAGLVYAFMYFRPPTDQDIDHLVRYAKRLVFSHL